MRKPILLTLTAILFVFVIYVLHNFVTIQDCWNCREELNSRYPYFEPSEPETYKVACRKEYKSGTVFPFVKPAYAVLHFDKLFSLPQRLTPKQTETILTILNDSGSYVWGEFGTAYFDRYITFHDSNDNTIGITQIDFGGQTYSTPRLARMKWGMLSDEGYRKLRGSVR